MAFLLRKVVVFLALIAFVLSSIIGLASGNHVPTIIFRGLTVFLAFLIVGWVLVPLFIILWGEESHEEDESAMLEEEGSSENSE